MRTRKLSISMPAALADFADHYCKLKHRRSRSQVFEDALKLLRNRELEEVYRASARDYDPDWEHTSADGLTDETW